MFRFVILIVVAMLAPRAVMAQTETHDPWVPQGDRIVEDQRQYSCVQLTAEEKSEVEDIALPYLSAKSEVNTQSCLARDSSGAPVYIMKRNIVHGVSSLLTYNEARNEFTLITWEPKKFRGVRRFENKPRWYEFWQTESTSVLELPIIDAEVLARRWKGNSRHDPNFL